MELKDIIQSINNYFKSKYPNNEGWFIGRMTIVPQSIKAYKKCNIEVYYHTSGHNELFLIEEVTEKATKDSEDKLKNNALIKLISTLLSKKEELDKYGI